ncbi:hypothetical protein AgCh_035610 [Apium graveolens]
MEYVREKKGSQPAEKHKIRQWMEYVRGKKGSQPKALLTQEPEICQGMEYFRENKGSYEQPTLIPNHEYKIYVSPESEKRKKIITAIHKVIEELRAPETDEVQQFTMESRIMQLRSSLDKFF